jgi:hypothetical protein
MMGVRLENNEKHPHYLYAAHTAPMQASHLRLTNPSSSTPGFLRAQQSQELTAIRFEQSKNDPHTMPSKNKTLFIKKQTPWRQ